MTVPLADGCCCACGGPLQIIHADDTTMTVACDDCGGTYSVDPDAFGDSRITRSRPFVARRRPPDEDTEPDPS